MQGVGQGTAAPKAKGAPQPMAHAAAMSAALPVASCAPIKQPLSVPSCYVPGMHHSMATLHGHPAGLKRLKRVHVIA